MDCALSDRWKENIIQEASLGIQQPDLIIQAFQRINHYHDLLHRSIMESCERSLIEQQTALPSFTYCWIEMGSGGRKERTLWTDQDNGIIYQCEEQDEPKVVHFLSKLSEKVVKCLLELGYPLCDGHVMATNPRWLKPVKGWINSWSQWSSSLSLDDIRYLLIAADLRPIYGDMKLTATVKKGMYQGTLSNLSRLAHHSLHQQLPIGFLRNLLTQTYGEYAGMFPVKEGGYYQLVSLLRLLALHAGIACFSTYDRIHSLWEMGYFTANEKEELECTLAFFLHLRLKNHLQLHQEGSKTRDYLSLTELSKRERRQLKEHLLFLKRLQKQWLKRIEKGGGFP